MFQCHKLVMTQTCLCPQAVGQDVKFLEGLMLHSIRFYVGLHLAVIHHNQYFYCYILPLVVVVAVTVIALSKSLGKFIFMSWKVIIITKSREFKSPWSEKDSDV